MNNPYGGPSWARNQHALQEDRRYGLHADRPQTRHGVNSGYDYNGNLRDTGGKANENRTFGSMGVFGTYHSTSDSDWKTGKTVTIHSQPFF